jgi:hypothetical protein
VADVEGCAGAEWDRVRVSLSGNVRVKDLPTGQFDYLHTDTVSPDTVSPRFALPPRL